MSSISSTGSSTSSMLAAMSGNRVTGLMSGLDTDELVKNMSATTRSKIATTQQKVTKGEWQQEAFRSLTTLLLEFQNKYTSYSSSTNLRSSTFFGQNNITAAGTYKQFVTASGSGSNAGSASLVAVHQLAKNASYISNRVTSGADSDNNALAITGGAVQNSITTYALAGQKITFQYGKDEYSITLDSNAKLDSLDAVQSEIKKQLAKVEIGNDKTLDSVVQVSVSDGSLSFTKASDDGSDLRIKNMGAGFKEVFGEEVVEKLTAEDYCVEETVDDERKMTVTGKLYENIDKTDGADGLEKWATYLSEKSFNFNYNGESKSIKLDEATLKTEGVQAAFKKALDDAFGAGRIKVSGGDAGTALKFEAWDLTKGKADEVSTLKLTGGDKAALESLGLEAGMSNRTNINDEIAWTEDDTLKINGVDIVLTEAAKDGLTKNEVINAINNGNCGLKVTYLEATGQWSIQATQTGKAGQIKIEGTVAAKLFGEDIAKDLKDGTEVAGKQNEGQDAIVSIDYGTGEPVQVSRSSNSFDLNGMKVTVSGEFNSVKADDGTYTVENNQEGVKFNASANTEKVTTAVKEMVEAYNAIIKLANSMVREKPDRSYAPLSEDQKEDMEEDEIEKWTTNAKKGILFNDSDLRMFTDELTNLFFQGQDMRALEEMGITASGSYSDNGKLTFDEEKFKAAMESDPAKVEKMFAGEDGIMTNVKTMFDKYGKIEGASKGIFVKRAGHEDSALSMLDNTIQKQIDEQKDYIEKLKEKLEKEVEKYYNMFASLETYISNMNSQSSMFMSMGS